LHDCACSAECSELNMRILESIVAFHDPIIDNYLKAPNRVSIEARVGIGRMRTKTAKILEAHYLL
jgi:hypothetical protein